MRLFAHLTPFLLVFLILNGCAETDNPSLYDGDDSGQPQPTIASITPTGFIIAGMDTVVIQGTNFSAVPDENRVYFNNKTATIVAASATQLKLIAPVVIGDSVIVRVAKLGSYAFSNSMLCKTKPGVASFGGLPTDTLSGALATDTSGNVYVAIMVPVLFSDLGVNKCPPAGGRSVYVPKPASGSTYTDLKMGPGGIMYALRNAKAVYRFPAGGGASATPWQALAGSVSDGDFDQNGNFWVGGVATSIYCVQQNKTVTAFPFAGGQVFSLRVYSGYLYIAAVKDSAGKIWRAPITSGSLGTPEVYFDFDAVYPKKTPLVITLSSDGVLYIGTDVAGGIVVVETNKSYSTPFSFYSSLFGKGLTHMAWGSSDDLYCSTINGTLLKFLVRGKKSAPYYGSTL